MARFVLTADRTLTSDFRNLPNAPFYACAPSDPKCARILNRMARRLYTHLAVPPPVRDGGQLLYAP